MTVKTKLSMAALTIVLLATPFLVRDVAAQRGDTDVFGADDLPLGLQLTETLHTIINEHKLAIKNAILEFKLKHDELLENVTVLIRSFIEERLNRTLEIKEAIRGLNMLYAAGNITREEYLARLSELRSELKALAKSSERLGKFLKEFVSEMREITEGMVEELRERNREFGRRISEEARKIRERIRNELREEEIEESNSTTTSTPQRRHVEDRGRGHNPFNETSQQTEETREDEHEDRGRGRGRGHEATSTHTTITSTYTTTWTHTTHEGGERRRGR